jgi:hypothetical protein
MWQRQVLQLSPEQATVLKADTLEWHIVWPNVTRACMSHLQEVVLGAETSNELCRGARILGLSATLLAFRFAFPSHKCSLAADKVARPRVGGRFRNSRACSATVWWSQCTGHPGTARVYRFFSFALTISSAVSTTTVELLGWARKQQREGVPSHCSKQQKHISKFKSCSKLLLRLALVVTPFVSVIWISANRLQDTVYKRSGFNCSQHQTLSSWASQYEMPYYPSKRNISSAKATSSRQCHRPIPLHHLHCLPSLPFLQTHLQNPLPWERECRRGGATWLSDLYVCQVFCR